MTTSPRTTLRRLILTATIGSFSFAALMGVVALLGAGFDDNQYRVLSTTLVAGFTSVAVLCYLGTAGSRFQLVGILGGLACVVPTVTALMLIWAEDSFGDDMWRTFGVGAVVAATLAQVCLLLGVAGARRSVGWLLWPTVGLAALLAAILSAQIVGDSASDNSIRFLGVVAILDVLGTVVTIALAKFGSASPAPALTVGLSGALAARLAGLAETQGRPASELLDEAVERYLRQSATR
jgi:hypothetical protein